MAAASRVFASLSIQGFRRYFAGQVVSFAGNWMQIVAQAALVERLTHSGTKLGLVSAVQFAPVLALAPFGGVVADRVDRRKASIVTSGLLAVVTGALGAVTLSGHVTLPMVFAAAAAMGAINAFDQPLRQSMVYDLVGGEHVANAVSLNTVIMNVARVTGPGLAALLIATAGLGWSFIGNAMSFAFMVVMLLSLSPADLAPRARASTDRRGWLREGFRYVRSERKLTVPLVVMAIIGMLTYEFQVVLPLLASQTFGRPDGRGYSMLAGAMGAGAIVGGLIAAARMVPTHQRFVRSAALLGAMVAIVSQAPSIGWAMVIMPFVGASSVTFIAVANSVLQVNARDDMRGRVVSLYTVALIGTTPIGAPLVGYIADHSGPRTAQLTGGIAALAGAALGWLLLRQPLSPSRARRADRRRSRSDALPRAQP